LFAAVADGATTPAAIAGRCGVSERGARMLCDALVAHGLLQKTDGRYALDPELAPFVDGRSPTCLARGVRFMASETIWQAFGELTKAVRKGGSVLPQDATTADNPIWVDFARDMAPLATVAAQLLANLLGAEAAGSSTVLDVAAGHGLFGITIAERNPQARVVALDWPNVLTVAKENAQRAGVSGRYQTIAGDAFATDWGSGYDLVLLTNILHHFDTAGCEALLRKAYRALAPGGRAVLLEFAPDESRVAPPEAATFALVMLTMTPGGDAYTFAEYDRMCRTAGFARTELHQLSPSPQQVVIAQR
ncbi:MAG TPA: class I SAM-dependent methyltransferase, partial [Solirubrobacteraceae bacterium]